MAYFSGEGQIAKNGTYGRSTLKQAMKYGEYGLEALKDMTLEEFETQIRMQRIMLSGKWLYYATYIVSRIPASFALPAALYMLLILYKTWFVRGTSKAQAKPVTAAAE
ncbi:hypothetical protein [Nitratidesulfovibrio sp.]|uniref:hypothetical protein n=1 Tax=Nitratidesulfovibrio sp. TaxID=2802297 RepID=UPI003341405D